MASARIEDDTAVADGLRTYLETIERLTLERQLLIGNAEKSYCAPGDSTLFRSLELCYYHTCARAVNAPSANRTMSYLAVAVQRISARKPRTDALRALIAFVHRVAPHVPILVENASGAEMHLAARACGGHPVVEYGDEEPVDAETYHAAHGISAASGGKADSPIELGEVPPVADKTYFIAAAVTPF